MVNSMELNYNTFMLLEWLLYSPYSPLFVWWDTKEQRTRIINEYCGTEWNGNSGWTFSPPLVFILIVLIICFG